MGLGALIRCQRLEYLSGWWILGHRAGRAGDPTDLHLGLGQLDLCIGKRFGKVGQPLDLGIMLKIAEDVVELAERIRKIHALRPVFGPALMPPRSRDFYTKLNQIDEGFLTLW